MERAFRRVVLTGLGVISPIGSGKEVFWSNLLEGKSGTRTIQDFDVSSYPSQIGGEVLDFHPENYIPVQKIPKMATAVQYAMGAAKMAIADAQMDFSQLDRSRVGVVIGTGLGGMGIFEAQLRTLFETNNPRRVHPLSVPMGTANAAAAEIAISFGLKGPNITISTACSSGANAIGHGLDLLRWGKADVILAGGTEACLLPGILAAFCSLRTLSVRNEAPDRASRPFDKNRDGFVMGEGAGIVVMETVEAARRRGAVIYAEVVGYSCACEASHMVSPDITGTEQARAISLALQDGGIAPSEVDYINTHGTSTLLNDVVETRAIKMVFGPHAHDISMNSTKSMIGHTIGAAGAIEAIVCALTLQRAIIHPTINSEMPDPECDLDYTPNKARERKVRVALSNSFGFGSNNACLVMKTFS
ncbi:MAG: beta-ketoacyl-ACP synthase II [Nitrospirae bacterium]|nr:beta-ketoacyl-ACP synthase II [Nitrospirota bacterium]